mmetsp:Transcript_18999/g.20466  ORF Transcript_18999/g.20466 Transcript_18999/m.20466 type:complete len:402 (-) Transcript_18999:498-1703(-)
MTDNTSFQEITTVPKTAASTVITVSSNSNSSSSSSVMASTRKRTTINADDNDDNDDNNDVGETVTVNISSKRPKVSTIVDHALAIDVDAAVDAAAVDDDTDAKTNVIVTPTMTTTTTDANTAITAKEEVETIVDIAESLRLKAGDRIEVQWEIHNDKDKDNNNNGKKEEEEIGVVVAAAATKDDGNANEKNTTTTTNDDDDDDEKEKDDGNSNDDDETNNDNVVVTLHWWKATLLEHDGRTLDSVAIRKLLYDARPDLGFPEPSLEDVIFMGHDVLINSEDVVNDEGSDDPDALIAVSRRMPFRRCDDINNKGEGYVARVRDENEIIFTNDDELEDILHTVLMGNFQKHQDKWKHLSAAQHAIIASTMKKKKDKLFTLIKEEVKHNKVITADSIKEMMTKI